MYAGDLTQMGMNDCVVLTAVSDIETPVTGLSQKIWQKVDIAGEIQLQ